MPAVNPRVSVTLTPALDATLKRLSDASGQSRSAIIAELLEQSEPVFERMATILETAKTATQEAKDRMAANLEEAHGRLLEHAGVIGDLFEDHVADLVDDVEQIGRRSGTRARGSGSAHRDRVPLWAGLWPQTPPCNTGVGYPGTHPEKARQNCLKARCDAGRGAF